MVVVMVWSLAQTSLGCAVMIEPVCGFAGFGTVRDGASNCASRISRSTRAFDVRTSSKRSRAHTFAMTLAVKGRGSDDLADLLEQHRIAPSGLRPPPPEHSPGMCGVFSLMVKAGTRHLPFARHAHHAITSSREGRGAAAHGFGLRQTKGRPASIR